MQSRCFIRKEFNAVRETASTYSKIIWNIEASSTRNAV